MMKKIFMASLALTTFSLAIIIFQMSSCKKSDAQTPAAATYPIEGLWIGTYTVDGQAALGQQYFSFIIKPDGTMIADGKVGTQQNLAIGTWSLTGTNLTCTFTSVYGGTVGGVEKIAATWSNAGKLTAGTWANVPASAGSGTFTMNRVN